MKDRYNHLLSKITERKTNVDKFIEVLHTQTTWLISPASTKYHLNKEGGLLEHSIGVAETLLQLRAALAPDISEESCVIVGLFHDIGKVGMPGKPYYLPEVKDGKSTQTCELISSQKQINRSPLAKTTSSATVKNSSTPCS